MTPIGLVLVLLLAASELLALIPGIAENSIFQLIQRGIRFLKDRVVGPFLGKSEEAPKEKDGEK